MILALDHVQNITEISRTGLKRYNVFEIFYLVGLH